MSMNKVILVGILAEKPVIRRGEGGQKMAGLSVVTRRHWHDAETGEVRDGREWHRVVIFDQHLADFAEAKLRPDDQVYIEGELHTERWRDETYEWRSLTNIILWQNSDQLRRLSPDEPSDELIGADDPMLAATREIHLNESPSWLGRVA